MILMYVCMYVLYVYMHACMYVCMYVCMSRPTIGEGRGCHKIVPVLGGDGTKIVPSGDLFDQPPGNMN